jgi:hypothetical protein
MEKTSVKSSVSDSGNTLNAKQAGDLFGVSAWAMYKRAKNGYIPHHYMGSRIYFKKDELMPFL